MSAPLEGKVALVTGGARGIGAGIALSLVEAGARVALLDLDGAAAEETAAGLGRGTIGVGVDASQESDMQLVVGQLARELGGIDVLVNNAGGGRPASGIGQPFTRVSQADWDEQLATNLRSAFAASKAAIPQLEARGGGAILNIASVAGLIPSPTTPAYAAAKAGMISLTRSLALELAPRRIRVNAICPGLLWTRAWEQLATLIRASSPRLAQASPRDIFLDRVQRLVPLGVEQQPEDIGQLVVFLAGEGARAITGQAIAVDGGLTLKVGA